jgi:hypothetical protein
MFDLGPSCSSIHILTVVGAVIVAAHTPSPNDTPVMAIPMIKSSFCFVISLIPSP